MERISELMLQPNENELRTTRSKPQLPDESVFALGALMQQARDYYPNQTLPEGTPDVYLKAWEELAQSQGMKRFEAGLWKALRSHDFFPTPNQIENACEEISATSANPRAALDKINAQIAHSKAHPELYVSKAEWSESVKSLEEKYHLQKPKEIDTTPQMLACPHCSKELPVAGNIRFWSGGELLEHGKLLKEMEAQAEANRKKAREEAEAFVAAELAKADADLANKVSWTETEVV